MFEHAHDNPSNPGLPETWLEPVLKRELRRVSAPDGVLGMSILREDTRTAGNHRGHRLVCCTTAAMLLVASVAGLHGYLVKDTSRGAGSNATQVRGWVKASTGLDLHAACNLCHSAEAFSGARHGTARAVAGGTVRAPVDWSAQPSTIIFRHLVLHNA
jgi:hypothetical protein